MPKRKIIIINEKKCTGCGLCIPKCPEGAIQIIDNKARLISDLFCDGLGACIGHCPEGAIQIEERNAKPYDERQVMENIIKAGTNTIIAHLTHLKEHGEHDLYNQAQQILKEKNIHIDRKQTQQEKTPTPCSCPGSQTNNELLDTETSTTHDSTPSQLRQWPIQFHLINPHAPYFKNADLLLTADCVGYSLGDYHNQYLRGKRLIIACPKLDTNRETYIEKLISLIQDAKINTLTVIMMEVPCCQGLLQLAKTAATQATRKIPIKSIIVSIKGEILREKWE
ncbi:MAG: 4Fe-4S binding protein [Candidatus Thermoplasmatota archaeon]|nr:4Fe-4S binding protein [Candidatus Thermoplasmatota archaeon]MBU1940841.1 4Fe-4S binding protein [Candidatus Thermoplasmatota archaeon]